MSDEALGRLCSSCDFHDTNCCICDTWAPSSYQPAQLCFGCIGEAKCVKCDNELWPKSRNWKSARVCSSCSVGASSSDCAKCRRRNQQVQPAVAVAAPAGAQAPQQNLQQNLMSQQQNPLDSALGANIHVHVHAPVDPEVAARQMAEVQGMIKTQRSRARCIQMAALVVFGAAVVFFNNMASSM